MDSTSPDNQQNGTDLFENFCFMVVEEFLKKKNLRATLSTFRSEWSRPSEDISLVSWYDIALKLRLPELVSQNSKEATIVENLVLALTREASVRSRRAPEVALNELTTIQTTKSVPNLIETTKSDHQTWTSPKRKIKEQSNSRPSHESRQAFINKDQNKYTIKRQLDSSDKYISLSKTNNKVSSEFFIPDEIRMKSLQRELFAAKATLQDIQKREITMAREMKRLQVTDLAKALMEESLDATHKIPCGCCQQLFLYVNLPLKVSRKAIQDIRIKWSGKLSSKNVFGATDETDEDINERSRTKRMSKKNSKTDVYLPQSSVAVGVVPRCYDEAGVCVFCAQFFHIQDEYRPSFQDICYQERKTHHFENKHREREYWDPLKMIEKDRDQQEKFLQQQQQQQPAQLKTDEEDQI